MVSHNLLTISMRVRVFQNYLNIIKLNSSLKALLTIIKPLLLEGLSNHYLMLPLTL